MEGGDTAAAIEAINKRLDWIEESLGRVVGLQYTPMGRAERRPDETPIPPEIQELIQQGKAKEAVKRYRELTGSSLEQAQAAIDSQM
jgi:ribosomal protein L7/L12